MLEALLDHTPRLDVRPVPFGAFHIGALAIILFLAILSVCLRRRLPRGEGKLRRALTAFGVGLLLLEIGKQITYSYDPVAGWAYSWDRFPFQFCSTPIYIALVAACLPDGRVRRACLAFLATYAPVAGLAVLVYPAADVFHEILFLNVHTVIWHGGMLLFGLYLWLTEAVTPSKRTARSAAAVYLPLPFIALALNELEMATGFAGAYTFNMFYIARDGYCMIPVLTDIQRTCPYPVFFAAYVLVLGAGGVLVTILAAAVRRLRSRCECMESQR